MDTRIIYECAKTYIGNVSWIFERKESEWIYVGARENILFLEKLINDFFDTDKSLYIALGRNDSFGVEKENIVDKIIPLVSNNTDFTIWNLSFQKVIEYSKIDVCRMGIKKSV